MSFGTSLRERPVFSAISSSEMGFPALKSAASTMRTRSSPPPSAGPTRPSGAATTMLSVLDMLQLRARRLRRSRGPRPAGRVLDVYHPVGEILLPELDALGFREEEDGDERAD